MIYFKKISLSIVYSMCDHQYKKMFEGEELIDILIVLGLYRRASRNV